MPITLPKTPALADLKLSLQRAAEDGKLDSDERADIDGRALKVMAGLKTKPQLDRLVDAIEESIKPLNYIPSYAPGNYGVTRQDFLGILSDDVKQRLDAVASDAAIDHNFP
jgi:hypothetical protein